MKKSHIQFELKRKNVDEQGVFDGYGSVFGIKDYGDDIVLPGAFADSLKERMPAMLWQHKQSEPIGVYTSVSEDEHGLALTGMLALKTVRGSEAYELMKIGAITGLSIGYTAEDWTIDQDYVRTIKKAKLWEVSPVTFPMNDSARINGVKSLESIMSLSDAEERLRDAGFSRADAKAFISKVKSCNQRDADSVDLDGVKNALLNAGLFK